MVKKKEIQLGDTVKDIHTGFTGVAVIKLIFINGCIQFEVAPKVNKKNELQESVGIDIQSLKVVKRKTPPRKKPTGGPNTPSRKMRGY